MSRELSLSSGSSPDYSVVIPVYYNAGSLPELLERLSDTLETSELALRGELIFIDDGSGDDSAGCLKRNRSVWAGRMKIIRLSRNFGQRAAIRCGLEHANGKAVVVISADGQDPVEKIPELLHLHFEEDKEIVVAARSSRDEALFRIWTSSLFYWFYRRLCFPNMPAGGFDFYLLGRRALDGILSWYEPFGTIQSMVYTVGYQPHVIYYRRAKREHGRSRWRLAAKITAVLDAILGNSFLPIRWMSLLGFGFALAGFLYAGWIIFRKLTVDLPVEGWAPMMVVVLSIGGVQMVMLGLIGEYLWRVLDQARQRPPYLIEAIEEDC